MASDHLRLARSWLANEYRNRKRRLAVNEFTAEGQRDATDTFAAVDRFEFESYLDRQGAPLDETIQSCVRAGWITPISHIGAGQTERPCYQIFAAVLQVQAPSVPGGTEKDDDKILPVVLSGSGRPVLVRGKEKPALTTAQFDVVQALLAAGEAGLTKDELDRNSRHGDARKVLKRLADSDADWRNVISLPGVSGGGYRIV